MPKKGANISLKGYDDLFSTEESRAEAQQERVQEISLSDLHPFEGHPFRVVDDEDMAKTVESIKEYGVLTPAIVRPDPDGGYEIISGHRRHHASELLFLFHFRQIIVTLIIIVQQVVGCNTKQLAKLKNIIGIGHCSSRLPTRDSLS